MRLVFLAFLAAVAFLSSSTYAPADDPDLTHCRAWQQSQANAGDLKAMGTPPARIAIMPTRYRELLHAEAGLEKTSVPGVELANGQFTDSKDDLGLFLIVPWLALRLGLPIAHAYDLFCGMVIAAGCISGIVGFLFVTSRLWARVVAIASVTLTSLLALIQGDVYLVLGMVPVALVPWILLLVRRASLWRAILTGFTTGALAVIANSVRSGTGVILLVFLALVWGFSRAAPFRIRVSGLGAAILGFVMVWGALQNTIAKRDTFLLTYSPQVALSRHHPFWHSVYIGLGYVKNPEVPVYKDEVGVAKVCSVDPTADFVSPAYEHVLKSATLQIARGHPGLIIREVATKALVELAYVLIFVNIGWIAFFRRPVCWSIDFAFFTAIAMNALFGILIIPLKTYLFGMIAYSALFGATSVILAEGNTPRGAKLSIESEGTTYPRDS